MNSPMLKVIAASIVVWGGMASAHPVPNPPVSALSAPLSPDGQEVANVVDAFHAALARGDAAAAAALLDEGAVIYEEGEAEQSKTAYVASHLPADITFLAGIKETVLDRSGAATSDLAWIASRGRMQGSFRDRPIDRETTETMVLRKTADGWRIVHIHWSSKKSAPA